MGTNDRRTSEAELVSRALTNLRGVFILILVSFHSCLAYLGSTAGPALTFEAPPYSWQAFPIVDERRFFGFDLYCAWEDVHVMAMMFFLSGLFIPASLRRKGPARFALDRALRLGVPFLFGVLVLAPLALYPVFHRLNPAASVADYLSAYVGLPMLPNGPQWFLWLLLGWSLIAMAVEALRPGAMNGLGRLATNARLRPGPFLAALGGAAALGYMPLALRYGAFDWYEHGPFSFQESRPLLYGVYFFAGAAVGHVGLGEGLLAPDGELARRWRLLAVVSPLTLIVWMGLTGMVLTFPDFAPVAMKFFSALAYVAANVAGVAFLLAATMRFCTRPIGWLAPLSRNALGIFVVHYPAMVWSQYALTGVNLPALVKASLVFAFTLSAALASAVAMRRTPGLGLLIGEETRAFVIRTPSVAAPRT